MIVYLMREVDFNCINSINKVAVTVTALSQKITEYYQVMRVVCVWCWLGLR